MHEMIQAYLSGLGLAALAFIISFIFYKLGKWRANNKLEPFLNAYLHKKECKHHNIPEHVKQQKQQESNI